MVRGGSSGRTRSARSAERPPRQIFPIAVKYGAVSGLILVDDGAHQTDAYQTCRNLLMSEAAEASSMPGLEINADQVKCSHGSTSTMIDDDEIFYLRARGIKPHVARQLVAQGFSVESISRLKNKALEDLVLRFAAREFHRISERVVAR